MTPTFGAGSCLFLTSLKCLTFETKYDATIHSVHVSMHVILEQDYLHMLILESREEAVAGDIGMKILSRAGKRREKEGWELDKREQQRR